MRENYRVTVPGGRRLLAMLVEANLAGEARLVALESIGSRNPQMDVELRGDSELVELPAHWVIGDQVG